MALTPHDLIDTDELAALLGVRPSTFRAMRSQSWRHRRLDGLPEPLRLVSGSPVWERDQIEAWMALAATEGVIMPKPDYRPPPIPIHHVPAVPVELPKEDEPPWRPWATPGNRE